MPELPDVEGFRRYVARYAAGRRVRDIRALDPVIVRNTTPQGLGRALAGRRLGDPERLGKWLVVPVDGRKVVLHFGMTGQLSWTTKEPPAEAHDRLAVEVEGGTLTYRAQRKLGGVWLARRGQALEDITGRLGPDATSLRGEDLGAVLGGRRGGIKAALMDQAMVAGIGNELSDEILWRARIDPRRDVPGLSDDERAALDRGLSVALRGSMRHGRIPTDEGWFKSVRGEEGAPCPRCGHEVATARVAGRTAWFCPHCQS